MSEFSAIPRRPSLATQVTEELLDAIASGRLQPGATLPTERALSAQFGVSRTVIREAVRGLEANGVLEIKSPRGATVAVVSGTHAAETLERYLRGAQSQDIIQPGHIAEIRITLELRLVELACERATDDDVDAMERELDAMKNGASAEQTAVHDAEFHRLIAVATHNALAVTLIESINATMRSIRVRSLQVEGRPALAVAQHASVLKAIRDRDATAARNAMDDHLEDSRHYYSSVGPSESAEPGADA